MQDNTPDFFEPVGGPLFSDWLIYPMHCGRLIQCKYRLYICMAFQNLAFFPSSYYLSWFKPLLPFCVWPSASPRVLFSSSFCVWDMPWQIAKPRLKWQPQIPRLAARALSCTLTKSAHAPSGSRSIFPSYFWSHYNFHSVSPSFPVYIYKKMGKRKTQQSVCSWRIVSDRQLW